ncbi:hypothetical protein [Mangrovicoccus ximenensis]|uniref:hypothetical protein n=1 Tax=Mangrovicoccus ximenensis TaxID=1911570 RepID=UPI00191C197A|nr:hypothetical protein [Mangrovicoccus ximenensis]
MVIDPIAAATAQALSLAALGASFSGRAWKPAAKAATGLPAALTRAIAMERP